MNRTQISLTEEQLAGLRRLARERGTSMAALIREAVDEQLRAGDRAARIRRALTVVGIGESDSANVSEHHDRYLADAYADR